MRMCAEPHRKQLETPRAVGVLSTIWHRRHIHQHGGASGFKTPHRHPFATPATPATPSAHAPISGCPYDAVSIGGALGNFRGGCRPYSVGGGQIWHGRQGGGGGGIPSIWNKGRHGQYCWSRRVNPGNIRHWIHEKWCGGRTFGTFPNGNRGSFSLEICLRLRPSCLRLRPSCLRLRWLEDDLRSIVTTPDSTFKLFQEK